MKSRLDLYTQEFRPRRQWGTLPQILLAWGLLSLLLLTYGLYSNWQHQRQSRQLAQLQGQLSVVKAEASRLEAQLAKHQPSPALVALLKEKQLRADGMQLMLQRLDQLAPERVQSYADLLADLAQIMSPQLSLERIQVEQERISLAGETRSSQEVPAWVDRFKQTHTLSGKQFSELALSRDKEGRLLFELRGTPQEKAQ